LIPMPALGKTLPELALYFALPAPRLLSGLPLPPYAAVHQFPIPTNGRVVPTSRHT